MTPGENHNEWYQYYCSIFYAFKPWHEFSNNVVCATNEGSDQPAHTRSLVRAFASRLNILWLLSYCPNIIWIVLAKKGVAQARQSLHLSKCHFVGNHVSRLILSLIFQCLTSNGPRREKTCLRGFANNTGADQPAHPRSLISAFVIRFLESIIS